MVKKNNSFIKNAHDDKKEFTYNELANQLTVANLLKDDPRNLDSVRNIYRYIENIVAQIPVSVYWMNKDFFYLGCSDSMAKLFHLESRHDIVGKTYSDLYDEKSAAHYKEADKIVMKGTPLLIEEPLFYPDGTKKIYLSNKIPLRDPQGEIIGMLGVSVDITEQKLMEAELRIAKENAEAANYMITEFVSNVGHDMATPISDVGSIAQMLYSYKDDFPELKELFDLLIVRSEDCEEVRRKILNAIAISNLDVKLESFSIAGVLLELDRELRATIGEQPVKIILKPFRPKKEDVIVTDRAKFKAILYDLLSNAIKFTEQGEITISVIKEGDLFNTKVSDTGIGIPSDKFEYIFQQYTKLSRSNKYGATFKGVGAGLYLARIRASILKAVLSVESEVGKGSTFTLIIPAVYSGTDELS